MVAAEGLAYLSMSVRDLSNGIPGSWPYRERIPMLG